MLLLDGISCRRWAEQFVPEWVHYHHQMKCPFFVFSLFSRMFVTFVWVTNVASKFLMKNCLVVSVFGLRVSVDMWK